MLVNQLYRALYYWLESMLPISVRVGLRHNCPNYICLITRYALNGHIAMMAMATRIAVYDDDLCCNTPVDN